MTLVDSADSVLVLYSYAGFPRIPSWALLINTKAPPIDTPPTDDQKIEIEDKSTAGDRKIDIAAEESPPASLSGTRIKMDAMSTLSIVLTLMSILVAFSISLITILALVGERCSQCAAAANAEDGGGLAGSWWRAWANVRKLTSPRSTVPHKLLLRRTIILGTSAWRLLEYSYSLPLHGL